MAFVNCTTFNKKLNELKKSIQDVSDNQENKQAKLHDCNGSPLAAGAKIPDCATVDEKIEKAVEKVQESVSKTAQKESKTVFQKEIATLFKNTRFEVGNGNNGELNLLEPKCREKIKGVNAPYTVANDDEVVVVNNGGVITLPPFDVGRRIVIIQGSSAAVTLKGQNGLNVLPPLGGDLTLAGANAVVSVLATDTNVLRVFGQTQEV